MKKKVNKKKYNKDIERCAFSGAFLFSILFFIITLLAKFSLIEGNFLFNFYAKMGYGTHVFGIVLSLIYGFVTGFLVFGLYAFIFNKMPQKK